MNNSHLRIYNAGAQPKIKNLYPAVSYPVSRGTPMLQSLIEWDHSVEWLVTNFAQKVNFYHNPFKEYLILTCLFLNSRNLDLVKL